MAGDVKMDDIETGAVPNNENRRPRWRTPKLKLDSVPNATGADLNAPGDDGQTVYPGIDLGNNS
jgi:hypothetical protein